MVSGWWAQAEEGDGLHQPCGRGHRYRACGRAVARCRWPHGVPYGGWAHGPTGSARPPRSSGARLPSTPSCGERSRAAGGWRRGQGAKPVRLRSWLGPSTAQPGARTAPGTLSVWRSCGRPALAGPRLGSFRRLVAACVSTRPGCCAAFGGYMTGLATVAGRAGTGAGGSPSAGPGRHWRNSAVAQDGMVEATQWSPRAAIYVF
jgi:hypothetical protein